MTVTTTPAIPAFAFDPKISGRPSKASVLDAIMRDGKCSRPEAGSVLKWISNIVVHCRTSGDVYYPTAREMKSRIYEITDTILPHGTAPQEGSAHAMVGALLLDPRHNETAIFHDNRDTEGNPNYCQVGIAIGVF